MLVKKQSWSSENKKLLEEDQVGIIENQHIFGKVCLERREDGWSKYAANKSHVHVKNS